MKRAMSAEARKAISEGMKRSYRGRGIGRIKTAPPRKSRIPVPVFRPTPPEKMVVIAGDRNTGLLIDFVTDRVEEIRVFRFVKD